MDDLVADDALGVDDEEAALRDALVLEQDAVAAAHFEGAVARERKRLLADRELAPRLVAIDAVGRDADDLRVERRELLVVLAERGHLGRADEGEVGGVEEEDEPLPGVVVERDLRTARAGLETFSSPGFGACEGTVSTGPSPG